MSGAVSYARAEWLVAVRRRRTMVLNVLVPAGLVAGLVFGGAPDVHASMVVTILFVFFATFGSAVPLVHDLDNGRFSRLLHAGGSANALLAQRVVVSAALDLLQLLPALAIVFLSHSFAPAAALIVALAATLVICNVLGVWIGSLTRSIGEAALISSVCALLLLHASGVFRTPVPNSWSATIAAFSPFAGLRAALRAAFGLGAPPAIGAFSVLFLMTAAALASLLVATRTTRDLRSAPRR